MMLIEEEELVEMNSDKILDLFPPWCSSISYNISEQKRQIHL